jgi:hypothetical protein
VVLGDRGLSALFAKFGVPVKVKMRNLFVANLGGEQSSTRDDSSIVFHDT